MPKAGDRYKCINPVIYPCRGNCLGHVATDVKRNNNYYYISKEHTLGIWESDAVLINRKPTVIIEE